MSFFKNQRTESKLRKQNTRKLRLESLEDRQLLSADGLAPLVTTAGTPDPENRLVVTGSGNQVNNNDGVINLVEALEYAKTLTDQDVVITFDLAPELNNTVDVQKYYGLQDVSAKSIIIDGEVPDGQGGTTKVRVNQFGVEFKNTPADYVCFKNIVFDGSPIDGKRAFDTQFISVENTDFNFRVENCVVEGYKIQGKGLFYIKSVSHGRNSAFELVDTVVCNNEYAADQGSLLWGAEHCYKALVCNCTVVDNICTKSSSKTKAVLQIVGVDSHEGNLYVYNTIFANNQGFDYDVWHETTQPDKDYLTVTVDHCLYDVGVSLYRAEDAVYNSNEIDPDEPLFAEGSQYVLADDSQALDASSDNLYYSQVSKYLNNDENWNRDVDFGGRFLGAIDVGAYEGGEPWDFNVPRLIVTTGDDEYDHTNDFNADGTPNSISLREAYDYIDTYFSEEQFWSNLEQGYTYEQAYSLAYVYTDRYADLSMASTAVYDAALNLTRGVYKTIYFDASVGGTVSLDNEIVSTKNFTINGIDNGGNAVTISGQDQHRAFYIRTNCVIANDLTFANCTPGDSSLTAGCGGAIYVAKLGGFQARDCTFQNNYAPNYGGAVCCAGFSHFGIETTYEGIGHGCEFTHNVGGLGGAIYHAGQSKMCIYDSTFADNAAVRTLDGKFGSGGAIYVKGGCDVVECQLTQNYADKYGGAISNFGSVATIGSQYTANSAGDGGAVQTAGVFAVRESVFERNMASLRSFLLSQDETYGDDFGGNGGAIFATKNASDPSQTALFIMAQSTSFIENTAENAGGAIDFLSGLFSISGASPGSCVFSENQAAIGGAIVIGTGESRSVKSALSPEFEFVGNFAVYGDSVVANVDPDGDVARNLKEIFFGPGVELTYNDFDTYTRHVTEGGNGAQIQFSDLIALAGVEMSKDVYFVVSYEDRSVEVASKGTTPERAFFVDLAELGITESGTYELTYCVYGSPIPSTTQFTISVVVTDDDNLGGVVARRGDNIGDAVTFEFVSYGFEPISSWTVNWGDGEDEQTYDEFGYSFADYHCYANSGSYNLTLTVEYADGQTKTYTNIAQAVVEVEPTVTYALLDEVFLTGDFFAEEDFFEF